MHKAKEAAGAKTRSLESPLRLVAGAEVAHSGCGEGGMGREGVREGHPCGHTGT